MIERVERFLEQPEQGIWFALLCEQGMEAIEAQAWQVADTLKEDREQTRDAMLELAYELLPDSPAGAEDPRQVLFRKLGVWASGQPREVQECLEVSLEDGFQEAWESGLYGFRKYLRSRCEVATREMARGVKQTSERMVTRG